MKKKLLLLAVFLLSVILSFYVGVVNFSKDNINNINKGYKNAYYSEGSGMLLYGWNNDGDTYISNSDSQIVINGIDSYVSTLRLDGKIEDGIEYVEVFYTDADGEAFSAEKHLNAFVSLKNDDIYITVDKTVKNIRIDIYPNAGHSAEISGMELNSGKLNVHIVYLILTFIIILAVGISAIEIIWDRKSLAKDLSAMKRYKYLLADLVSKDIKTKYRRSVLGVLWSVLNPLLMMLVLTAVFSNIIRVEVEGGFALFYLTGYIIFNFVSEATNFSLVTITSAAPLIKKVYIPKYIFPLEKCIFSFVNMLFSMIAFVIVFTVFAFTGTVTPHATMLLFPLPMIYVFIFCLGLCLILSAVMVFFRDIGHIWGILLTVWMYASPIIYPISLVPSWLGNIIKLNPLYYYIDYFRNVMIYGTVPGFTENLICIFYAVAVFLLGVVVFRKSQDKFILYI